MLIAIEGVDGAGKRTLTDGLRSVFESQQKSVVTVAFPRYKRSITADIAAEALHGGHGDLADSVYAMAVLFALDRADARDEIAHLTAANDVVILDRYVASNAAYSAARLHQGADGGVVAWVRDLEYDRLELRSPIGRCCSRCPSRWPPSAPKSAPEKRPTVPGTPTNATTDCSSAPPMSTVRSPRRLVRALGGRSSRYRRDSTRGEAGGVRPHHPSRAPRQIADRRRSRSGGAHAVRRGQSRRAYVTRMPGQHAKRPCGSRGLSRSGDTMDTMRQRILVVDDDPSLAEMLTIVLRGEGFDTAVIGDGTQALTAVRELRPDLVLLDLMLPGMNGIDVCRVLRADSGVPIVMLTAKTDTVDVVLGLESGADDYVMKPFKPKELVARVRARLRRNEDEPAEMLSIADVEIDVPAHKVTRLGEQISLTPLEFDLLVALARKPRQVFTRDVLLEQVWGYRHPADTRLVNVHVQRLRAKVEKDPENPQVVLTVRGVGYKAGPP